MDCKTTMHIHLSVSVSWNWGKGGPGSAPIFISYFLPECNNIYNFLQLQCTALHTYSQNPFLELKLPSNPITMHLLMKFPCWPAKCTYWLKDGGFNCASQTYFDLHFPIIVYCIFPLLQNCKILESGMIAMTQCTVLPGAWLSCYLLFFSLWYAFHSMLQLLVDFNLYPVRANLHPKPKKVSALDIPVITQSNVLTRSLELLTINLPSGCRPRNIFPDLVPPTLGVHLLTVGAICRTVGRFSCVPTL